MLPPQDTQEPILFSEWSAVGGTLIKRRDFHQDELLRDQSARTSLEQAEGELSLQYVPKSPTREFPPWITANCRKRNHEQ